MIYVAAAAVGAILMILWRLYWPKKPKYPKPPLGAINYTVMLYVDDVFSYRINEETLYEGALEDAPEHMREEFFSMAKVLRDS